MSESTHTFAVFEVDLNLHRKDLLQGKDKDFLILGKLNNRKEFTHDETLKETLSSFHGVVEMNNKMGDILKEDKDVDYTIVQVKDGLITSFIVDDKRISHGCCKYFYVIQVAIEKRCLVYFYYPNSALLSDIKQFIKYQIEGFKTILGNKQKKIDLLERKKHELVIKIDEKIKLIRKFYPNISSGGSKKVRKIHEENVKQKKLEKQKEQIKNKKFQIYNKININFYYIRILYIIIIHRQRGSNPRPHG